MIDTECFVAAQQAVVAEQPAGQVTHDDVRVIAGAGALFGAEQFVVAPESGTTARNAQFARCHFGTAGVVQMQLGSGLRVPGC